MRRVAAGQMDRGAAVQRIVEYSDGGLTRRGAEDLLDNWATARGRYQQAGDIARDGLRRLNESGGER